VTTVLRTALAAAATALVLAGCEPARVMPPPGSSAGGSGGSPPGTPAVDRTDARTDAAPGVLVLPDAAPAADAPPAPPATCAAETFEASPVAVDLVFVIDQSPSMLYQIGGRTKWSLAREALGRFLQDPQSAGLGVGFLYFPTPSTRSPCTTDEDCGFILACKGGRCMYPIEPYPSCALADYTQLSVPIATLPAAAPALTRSMMREPYENWGASPMGIAAKGVYTFLRARPPSDRQPVVVLVTDGVPSGCFSGWIRPPDIVAGLGEQVRLQPSIRTFVIGLFSDRSEDQGGEQALTQFAMAGGTGMPFFVRPPADVNAAFLAALDQIRAASLPCEYVIPAGKADTLDFQKVNLHFKGSTRDEDIPYVGRADRCDPMRGGWYYDVDPAMGRPTRVIACPATCSEFKAGTGKSQVSLAYGCRTRTID
jgi:hypothetical protein